MALALSGGLAAALNARAAADAAPPDLRQELESLRRQNAALEALLRQQAALIENLNQRLGALEAASMSRPAEAATPPPGQGERSGGMAGGGLTFGNVHLSGEGAVAFLHSGRDGMWPNSEFRVDEAKLFVEAPVWKEVYFFSELNLATREHDDLDVRLGECYLDFENVSQLWGRERQLNARLGRLDIPFGEEYLTRDAIANPLISHSLADLWGVDEGVELYGELGKWSYVVAVQNGGVHGTRDFHRDKSVAGRLGWDPTRWLHLSVSAMRTGELDAQRDALSEIWFGGGWFRSIGGPDTTRFHANLLQGDVAVRLPHGHLKAFGGVARYDDNDPAADNRRDLYYYAVEAAHHLTRQLYAAARFSHILVEDGYPLPGHGNMGEYFFSWDPDVLTEELWRLSLGLGWRFSERLVLKVEYAFERGRTVGGERRDREDVFAAQAAFQF